MRNGAGGRTPKRSTQRAGHRTKAEQPDRVRVPGVVAIPEPDAGWHAAAADWYRSLADSGQSRYYEPSDWRQAWVLAGMLSALLSATRPSSELFKAWLSGAQDLGVTEAARRRMKIEIERPSATPEPDGGRAGDGKVAVMARYRKAAGG